MHECFPNPVSQALAARVQLTYAISLPEGKGFLPPDAPLPGLPEPFAPYLDAVQDLPQRFDGAGPGPRAWLDRRFAQADVEVLAALDHLSWMQHQHVMTLLCALAHTYRWEQAPPDPAAFAVRRLPLPPGIDGLWTQVARRLGLPRVGSVWTLKLCNWTLTAKLGGSVYTPDELTLDRLGLGYGWFQPPLAEALELWVLTFVETEARGVAVVQESVALIQAVARDDADAVADHLERLHGAITAMNLVFYTNVRTRLIDPAVWTARIQPVFGWGLDHGEGPLEGASGLQLGSIQCADAVLDVNGDGVMAQAAVSARGAMPEAHRRFLAAMDAARPLTREFVRRRADPLLTGRYNACVEELDRWRQVHHKRGELYLQSKRRDQVLASTGLTIQSQDDALTTFADAMLERIGETRTARLGEGGGAPAAMGMGPDDGRSPTPQPAASGDEGEEGGATTGGPSPEQEPAAR